MQTVEQQKILSRQQLNNNKYITQTVTQQEILFQ